MKKLVLALSLISMGSVADCASDSSPEVTIQELAYMEKSELEKKVCFSIALSDFYSKSFDEYIEKQYLGLAESAMKNLDVCDKEKKNAKRVLAKDHNLKLSDEEWVNHCETLKK